MNPPPFRIKPFGPNAVLLEWPPRLELEILFDILGFADFLKQGLLQEPDWEYVPIYHSLTLISRGHPIEFGKLETALKAWYEDYPGPKGVQTQHWELPVCYDPEFGLDLERAAQTLNMEPETLIRKHGEPTYRVFGIGFLPGFLYLGGVPEELRLPRLPAPRPRVPQGSVGLADRQTGIYPQESPGGWNILGKCPLPLFDPKREPPSFIGLGDSIRFRAVSRAEFDLHRIEAEVGVYDYKKKYGNAAR